MTTLFVMPIRKGKKSDYLNFVKECLGPKREEYKDLLKRYALHNVKTWTHSLNGNDYAMFTHDMDEEEANKRLKEWSSSTHPFDQWFDQQLKNCYEIESLDNMPPQPEFLGEMEE